MSVQKSAAKKFGCSFEQAARKLGAKGYSINEAAYELGYTSGANLRRIVNANGWGDYFLPPHLTRGGEKGQQNLKRHSIPINGVVDSFSGHSRRAGIPRSTAWKRYKKHGPKWHIVFACSP